MRTVQRDYTKVQEILIGCVAVFLIVLTILGPCFERSSPLPSSNAVVDGHDGHGRAGATADTTRFCKYERNGIGPAKGVGECLTMLSII